MEIKLKKPLENMEVTITITTTFLPEYKIRLWIGMRLFQLAYWVWGAESIDFEFPKIEASNGTGNFD